MLRDHSIGDVEVLVAGSVSRTPGVRRPDVRCIRCGDAADNVASVALGLGVWVGHVTCVWEVGCDP